MLFTYTVLAILIVTLSLLGINHYRLYKSPEIRKKRARLNYLLFWDPYDLLIIIGMFISIFLFGIIAMSIQELFNFIG